MNVLNIAIEKLFPDPANARRHPQRNLDALMASLLRFGQQKPLVIDANNIVRAGNGTLAAAKGLGWKELACVRSELLGGDMSAYAIADNRTAELAEWDPDLLHAALGGMDEAGLRSLAFDDSDELDKLLGRPSEEESVGDQPIESTFEVVVECRDETHQQEVFERLVAHGETCRILTM